MEICAKTKDGEHRLEAKEFRNTETEYLCTACGQSVVYYLDNQGC